VAACGLECERGTTGCIRRHHAFALPPIRTGLPPRSDRLMIATPGIKFNHKTRSQGARAVFTQRRVITVCLCIARRFPYSGCCRTHARISGRCRAKLATYCLVKGPPCSRAHCSTTKCPPCAAHSHTYLHGQPCARAHSNTARCPLSAALWHVKSPHGQSCSRAHRRTSRCQPSAAIAQSTHSTRSYFAAHIATRPGARSLRRVHTFLRSTGRRAATPTYCSTSRYPPIAAP
jgi:hypothetical protein